MVDTEGVAVIMCEHNLLAKYQALTHGTRVLESCLHRNLTEHINSEIGMGTITDLDSAKGWLRGSFFYQRVRKNPRHYAIGDDDQSLSWQDRMDNLVLSSIKNLQENQLIEEKEDSATNQLVSTEYGEIMSKVNPFSVHVSRCSDEECAVLHPSDYGNLVPSNSKDCRLNLRLSGEMAEILAAPKNATLRDLMEVMSRSEECVLRTLPPIELLTNCETFQVSREQDAVFGKGGSYD